MIIKVPQISSGIRIQPFIQQSGDNLPLYFKGTGGNIHHLVKALVKIFFVRRQIRNTGHIDSYHPNAACALSGAEIPACFLSQFSQIQTKPAAHGTYVAGLHVGINIIAEIRGSVFCCHFKEESVVFCVGPVKILGNRICRDRILEASSVGIALNHDLNEGLVDHIHFLLAVLIKEIHFFTAHHGRKLRQVVGHCPVQGDIGKRRLGSPAAGGIYAINKGFNTFFHFRIGQVIHFNKGGQIGVKRGESLGSRPFVLHDPEEVYHLIAQHGKMGRRSGGDLSRNSSQAFRNQLLQRPAGTVSCKHGQVMNMDVRIPVGFCDFLIVYFRKPVIGCYSAGVAQDKTSYGIGDGGVFFHTPVFYLYIAVNHILVIQDGGFQVTDLLTLLTVKDICLCHFRISSLLQYLLHAVLDILHMNGAVLHLILKICGDTQCQQIDNIIGSLHIRSIECFHNHIIYLG